MDCCDIVVTCDASIVSRHGWVVTGAVLDAMMNDDHEEDDEDVEDQKQRLQLQLLPLHKQMVCRVTLGDKDC